MPAGAYLQALEQIEAADLPCPVYRTARRLLDGADFHAGCLRLSEAAFKALCQSDAKGTMRSHLVQLQAAGIVRYSRKGFTIRIQFEAWSNPLPMEPATEKVIAERSLLENGSEKVIDQRSDRALSDHFYVNNGVKVIAERSLRALSDHFSADSLTRVRVRALGGWVDPLLPKTRRSKKTTHPPQTPEAEQLALGLLVDREIGISFEVAQVLARTLPALDIYRTVDKWLPDAQAGKVTEGALVSRLKRLVPSEDPKVALSAGFRSSDLFHRHRLPDEVIAVTDRRKYSVDDGYPADDFGRKYSL